MVLLDLPFSGRLLVLVAVLGVAAGLDRWRYGPAARRGPEYLALAACGALGAAFGLAADQVTSRLSPAYFVWGKGLDEGPGFARAVVELSLQAGLVAGLVLGGVLLLGNQPGPGRPALALPTLVGLARWPVLLAAGLAPPCAAALGAWDPLGLVADFDGLGLTPLERAWVARVWGAHVGIYLGAVTGTVVACLAVRARRRSPLGPAAPADLASPAPGAAG